MRILIVEDNADITANLGAYLEPRGYVPDIANNGYGGLALMVQNDYDTSLMYVSNHGESLGEKHMFLHGAPYILAPDEQRHVPFTVWLSDGFRSRFHIDRTCLAARAGQSFSHDNVLHSTLGMLNVITAVYNPALDMFRPCDRSV